MNTDEDWKREKADAAPCRSCKGLGYLPANYSRGAIPCGCDETLDEYEDAVGTAERSEDVNHD